MERLQSANDRQYYDSVYNQIRYSWGEAWRKDAFKYGVNSTHGFPHYPSTVVRHQEIGRSRRVCSSQFIGLSRTFATEPEPECPQVDKFTAEVRKQFWLTRYRGEGYGEGEWSDEEQLTFMDGDGLGIGWTQVLFRTNRRTGQQQVHLENSPLLFTLWDRFEVNPGRARWIAPMKYISFEDAELYFGKELAEKHMVQSKDDEDMPAFRQVRYVEYYDIGYQNGAPTRKIILGGPDGEVFDTADNPFGCLPFSHITHLFVPSMRRPVGRIALQMHTQEALNEVERAFRNILRMPSFTIADVKQLDVDDLEQVRSGKQGVIVKWKSAGSHGGQPPFQRVVPPEVAQSLLEWRDMLERQFTIDSQTTDFERGVRPTRNATLGRDMLIDQRSQVQNSWTELQAVKYHQRTISKVFDLARMFDRDPVTLDIFGRNYTVNDPERPASSMENWLAEPSRVIINVASLRQVDDDQKRAQKLGDLGQIAAYVPRIPLFDPQWFAEQLARAIGEQDPKIAIAPNLAAAMVPQAQQAQALPPG